MASTTTIDTTALTALITEFRKITAKDAITPETVGALLQKIANLLGTCGAESDISTVLTWYQQLRKAGEVVHDLRQGTADRNHVYLRPGMMELDSGEVGEGAEIKIQQATTERAGAMRAQQVTDLNTLRTKVNSTLEPAVTNLQSAVAALQSGTLASTAQRRIGVEVVGGVLTVTGYAAFVSEGYVPYLFRSTRRRNRTYDSTSKVRDHSQVKKGWHMFGSKYSIKVSAGQLLVRTCEHSKIHQPVVDCTYSVLPEYLVAVHTRTDGSQAVPWGRTMVKLKDRKSKQNRMLRFRFAIGYGPAYEPARTGMSAARLVSNLAEFSVVYNPAKGTWRFSR